MQFSVSRFWILSNLVNQLFCSFVPRWYIMKDSWKILKLGIYVFALPLVATAAASAHQWMSANTVLAVAPAPAAVTTPAVARINAVRNHTITLNEDGEVQGRVASINHKTKVPRGLTNVTVYFAQDGRIVRKGYTNEDGTFVVDGLDEGVYSFVAANEFSFATCGVKVIKGNGNSENYIEVAAISPNVKAVREIIENELPESISREISSKLNNSKGEAKNVAGSNRVELDGDILRGEIVSLKSEKLGAGTKAHLFKGNTKVGNFEIAADGTFEVSDVTPGVYDIVVVGPDGLAAVSFEAVAEVAENSDEAYTSLQESLFANFIVALAPQIDGGVIGGCCGGSDAVVYNSSPVQFAGDRIGGGIAGGGCCGGAGNFSNFGGCCGGGRGLGRFGLLGGLGGIGGLAVPAIAAGIAIPLATSGNNGGGNPVSPEDTE